MTLSSSRFAFGRSARHLLGALVVYAVLGGAQALADEEVTLAALKQGGHVIVMRHALAPGTFDPQGFKLDDCATQRNLSDEGRAQAKRLGERLKQAGVPIGDVLSSQWCRCLDTARLAFGKVTPWPALNSLRGPGSNEARQIGEIKARVAAYHGRDNLVMVTHGFNLQALAADIPASAEMLVFKPDGKGGYALSGRVRTP